MAQGVTAAMFRDTGALESLFHSSLQHRFRHMVSALHPGARINGAFSRGKDILPDPRGTGLRIFPVKGVRQVDLPVSVQEILVVEEFHPGKMPLQRLYQRTGEHSDAVLRPLPIAHGDLMVGKIDIFYTQAHAFHEAQSSPIEQAGHQVGHTREPGEDGVDFIAGKDGREAARAFGAFNILKCGKWLF